MKQIKFYALLLLALTLLSSCNAERIAVPERIQAFCIDFNWSGKGEFSMSMPEDYNIATAQSQYKWHEEHGVNTIQSFCVSHNGYAWYDSKIAPKVPGLKGNFLKELVDLGHKNNKLVMGYFSPAANLYWKQNNPTEVYDDNAMFHVVYTKKYLKYLDAVIREAIQVTGIDGFMIDAVFATPGYANKKVKWLDCEKEMYTELFNKPFPGVENISAAIEEEYLRRSLSRCWEVIYTATKETDPNCIIWVTAHDLQTPQLQGTKLLKQVDWLMNESFEPEKIKQVKTLVGKDTRLIQCVVGWGAQHDAKALFEDDDFKDMGFYGFAWPDIKTAFPPTLETAGDNERFIGNAKNIEEMSKFYLSKD